MFSMHKVIKVGIILVILCLRTDPNLPRHRRFMDILNCQILNIESCLPLAAFISTELKFWLCVHCCASSKTLVVLSLLFHYLIDTCYILPNPSIEHSFNRSLEVKEFCATFFQIRFSLCEFLFKSDTNLFRESLFKSEYIVFDESQLAVREVKLVNYLLAFWKYFCSNDLI